MEPDRVVIAFDGVAWFVRSVGHTTWHADGPKSEMIYHCDKHLAGPLTFDAAVAFVKENYPRSAV